MASESYSALFLQNPQLAIALRRRAEADAMMKEGMSGEPIRHWAQGANNLAKALIGGYDSRKADEEMKAGVEKDEAEMRSIHDTAMALMQKQQGGQAPQPPPSAVPMTSAGSSGGAASMGGGGGIPGGGDPELPRRAYDRLLTKGWTPAQAAGMVGTLRGESPFNKDQVHDGGIGYGILGWNGSRRTGFQQFAGKPIEQSTFDEQVDYMDWELRHGPEKKAGDALATAGDARTAAAIYTRLGVRPKDIPTNERVRGGYADAYYRQFSTPPGPAQGASLEPGAEPQRQQFASASPGTATDAGGGMGEPVPQPMGAPQQMAQAQPGPGGPGMPTRPQTTTSPMIADMYSRYSLDRRPHVRAYAERVLGPLVKKDTPSPISHEVPGPNGMMQKVISYDNGRTFQPVGVAYDPRGPDRDGEWVTSQDGKTRTWTPRPQLAGVSQPAPPGTPTQIGTNVVDPTTGRVIGPAPPPKTAEEATMREQYGQSAQPGAAPGAPQQGQGITQAVTGLKTAGELGQVYAKRAEAMMTGGDKARSQAIAIQQITAIGDLLKTGALQPARQQISALGNALGIDMTKIGMDQSEAGLSQAYGAIVNKLVQSNIGADQGMSTAQFSNRDLDFVTGQQAKISNDPLANTIILQSGKAVADRLVARADALTDYLANGGNNIAQFERDWNTKMKAVPLFQEATREQFQSAPPGVYAVRKPDGKDWDVMVKPLPAQPQEAAPAREVAVPPPALEYLRKNPNTAAQFDARFGQGAAARALGQK